MSGNELIRDTVRIILINSENKVLLTLVDDPLLENPDGSKHPPFWLTPGGGIDSGETIEDAAFRELYEETGIIKDKVELGPIVWRDASIFIRAKRKNSLNQRFIIARTDHMGGSFDNITESEKGYLKKLKWFSYSEISKIDDIIRPHGGKEMLLHCLEEGFAALNKDMEKLKICRQKKIQETMQE